jgi:rare lipoprotein A
MAGNSLGKLLFSSILVISTFGLPIIASAQSGIASVYDYPGGQTASGERGSSAALTAAHRTLPFGTMVRVTDH